MANDIDPKKILASQSAGIISRHESLLKTPSVTENVLGKHIAELNSQIDTWSDPENEFDLAEAGHQLRILYAKRSTLINRQGIAGYGSDLGHSKRLISSVNREYGPRGAASTIGNMASNPHILAQGAHMGSSMSSYAINSQSFENQSAIANQQQVLHLAALNYKNDGGRDSLAGGMGRMGSLLERGAALRAAENYQRTHGLDANSIQKRGFASEARILGDQAQQQNIADIRDGRVGSFKDESSALVNVQKQLIEALNKLRDGTITEGKQLAELNDTIDTLTKEEQSKKNKVDEMRKAGLDQQPGILGKIAQMGAGYLGDAGRIALAAGDANRQMRFQIPYEQRELGIRGANMVNQQFDDHMGAVKGDGAALRRATSGLYGRMKAAGQKAYSIEGESQIMEVGGKGALLSEKAIVDGADGVASLGGGRVITKAIGDNAMAGSDLAAQARRAYLGIPQMNAGFMSAEQERRYDDATYYVGDAGDTRKIQQVRSAASATIGAGGMRAGIMSQLMDSKFLNGMISRTGMSLDEINETTSSGFRGMGKKFRMADVTNAGTANRAGLMSSSEYMQNASSLSEVGGGGKELEAILQRAVTSGMDNSKNIAQIVSATTSVASNSASQGINAAGAAGQLIGRMTMGTPGNENIRAQTAAKAIGFFNAINTDTSYNMTNVMKRQDILKIFPNATPAERNAMSNMDETMMQAIVAGGPEGQNVIDQRGLGSVLKTPMQKKRLAAAVRGNAVRNITSWGALGGQDMMAKMETASQYDMLHGTNTLDELMKSDKKVDEFFKQSAAYKENNGEATMKGMNWDAKDILTPRSTKGDKNSEYSTTANIAGARADLKVSDMGQPLSVLVTKMESVANTLTPAKFFEAAKNAAEKMTMPGDVAKTFGDSTGQFKTSVERFEKAVEGFLKQGGEGAAAKVAEQVSDLKQALIHAGSKGKHMNPHGINPLPPIKGGSFIKRTTP